ncbi:MAG: hypothetical protein ABFD50_21710 [Smithella sp.]
MNNVDKLIAAQHIIKQANIGALLGRLGGSLGRGLNFAKKNPFTTAGLGLTSAGMYDALRSVSGRDPKIFSGFGKDRPNALRDMVQSNPILNKVVGTESIFAPGFFNRGMRPQQVYRGPQDFRPGLR